MANNDKEVNINGDDTLTGSIHQFKSPSGEGVSGEIAMDRNKQTNHSKTSSVSSYIYSELTRGYWLEHDEAKYSEKRDRVHIFMKIPRELEKFMTYGFFQCLDAFLYVFTFLPLRFIVALLKFVVKGTFSWCLTHPGRVLEPAQICDLLKGLLVIGCCVLMEYVDVSMMYHLIRGQAIIKLYIFFNMLEVGDRLFASFGQDILDSLFWTATETRGRRREHFGLIPHLLLAVLYVFLHAILILFQATTLNVAFNSHNKALLTIMMSNNFVELKGSVFKKFEKNNLFQMSCSDVRERFHFLLLLAIVCIRNLTEFAWNVDHLWVLVPDVLMVMGSEFLVDWVKHAFITKFNEIPDEVYKEYTMSIAYDMVQVRQKKSHSDQMDLLSRRMGFTPLPLAVILVRIVGMSLSMSSYKTWLIAGLFYLCLVTLKVLNSIILLGKACHYTAMARQKPSDKCPSHPPSQPPTSPSPPSSRRLSDPSCTATPGVQELAMRSCFKRCTSLGAKMNVTFSDSNTETVTERGETDKSPADGSFVLDNSLENSTLGKKTLFSNSTVSLESVGLNEEFIKDTQGVQQGEGGQKSSVPDEGGKDTKDSKNGRPQKPLSEIDRYTMCSNRII